EHPPAHSSIPAAFLPAENSPIANIPLVRPYRSANDAWPPHSLCPRNAPSRPGPQPDVSVLLAAAKPLSVDRDTAASCWSPVSPTRTRRSRSPPAIRGHPPPPDCRRLPCRIESRPTPMLASLPLFCSQAFVLQLPSSSLSAKRPRQLPRPPRSASLFFSQPF